MKITFLARSLDAGGAERQLVTLACGLKKRGDDVTVILFYGTESTLERELVDSQVRVVALGKTGRWEILRFLNRLYTHLRVDRPDVLHSYLVVPNILVALLRPLLPRTATVWGIRASDVDLSQYDRLAQLTFRASCWLSRFPDLIISNSEAGRRHHIASGYRPWNIKIVPNGIDTEYFRPNLAAGKRLRGEWSISEATPLIGMVARLDPMKDHWTFLQAAAALAQKVPEARFVCVGDGPAEYRRKLQTFCNDLGLSSKVIWTGNRTDLPDVYSALSLATLTSSCGEGFPNVVAEAMACGTPVVATDVGDVSAILGSLGSIVPPGSPVQLVDAWVTALRNDRTQADVLRRRIVLEFSVANLIETSRSLLLAVADSG